MLNIFKSALRGNIANIILSSLMSIIVIAIPFYLIDSVNLPPSKSEGVVISKKYSPETYVPTTTVVNKVLITTMNHVPESWKINVKVGEGIVVRCEVNEIVYNNLLIKGDVVIYIANGRLTNSVYCKGIIGD